MASGGFSVTITAVDHATAAVNKINARIAAMGKPARDVMASVQRFAEASGLSTIARGFSVIGSAVMGALGGVLKFAAGLGVVSVALTAAGMAAMTTRFGEFGKNLVLTAQGLGTTVDKLSILQNAAKLAGASTEDMTSSLQGLKQTMQDAIYGRNDEARNIFANWHDDIGNYKSEAKDATTQLDVIADKVKGFVDSGHTQAAQSLLKKLGISPNMLNMMKDGREGLQRYMAAAEKLGSMHKQSAEEAFKLNIAETALGISFDNLGNNLIGSFAPKLTEILDHITDFITKNMPYINEKLDEFTAWLEKELPTDGIDGVEASLQKMVDTVKQAGRALDDISRNGLIRHFLGLGDTLVEDEPAGSPLGNKPAGPTVAQRIWQSITGGSTPAPAVAPPAPAVAPPAPIAGSAPPPAAPAMPAAAARAAGMAGPSAVSTAVPLEGRAFLDAVAPGESDGSYRPQVNKSTQTFGRYQFKPSTWAEVAGKTGLHDPTPENQDRNAWFYAQERYKISTKGRDLSTDIKNHVDVQPGLNKIWTSMQGGAEANAKTAAGFQGRIDAGLARGTQVAGAGSSGGQSIGVPSADEVLHHLHVTIENKNAPPGQQVGVKSVDPATRFTVAPARQEMPMVAPA